MATVNKLQCLLYDADFAKKNSEFKLDQKLYKYEKVTWLCLGSYTFLSSKLYNLWNYLKEDQGLFFRIILIMFELVKCLLWKQHLHYCNNTNKHYEASVPFSVDVEITVKWKIKFHKIFPNHLIWFSENININQYKNKYILCIYFLKKLRLAMCNL